MADVVDFVELVHCISLAHPQAVADAFADHVAMLQAVLERVQAEACEPFQASPEDDTEPLAEYVDFIVQAFGADPGHAADAFAGHEDFLRSVLALIKGEGGAVPQQGSAPFCSPFVAAALAIQHNGAGGSIASDMDVADLVHLLADAS
eukprot:EG_transcript_39421